MELQQLCLCLMAAACTLPVDQDEASDMKTGPASVQPSLATQDSSPGQQICPSHHLTAAMPEPLRGRETEGSRASSALPLLPSLKSAARAWDSRSTLLHLETGGPPALAWRCS